MSDIKIDEAAIISYNMDFTNTLKFIDDYTYAIGINAVNILNIISPTILAAGNFALNLTNQINESTQIIHNSMISSGFYNSLVNVGQIIETNNALIQSVISSNRSMMDTEEFRKLLESLITSTAITNFDVEIEPSVSSENKISEISSNLLTYQESIVTSEENAQVIEILSNINEGIQSLITTSKPVKHRLKDFLTIITTIIIIINFYQAQVDRFEERHPQASQVIEESVKSLMTIYENEIEFFEEKLQNTEEKIRTFDY